MSCLKKIVVVGDGGCGKTCLCVVFSKNEFPEDHIPTIYDTYTKTIEFNNEIVELALWDTAGEEEYDRLRPLSYQRTDAIILCFSIDNPDSLDNVIERWAPELKYFCPGVPIILVGNKLDLRNNTDIVQYLNQHRQQPISCKDGCKVAKKIKAKAYIECSAKYLINIKNVFITAAQYAIETENKPKRTWFCNCR